MGVHVLLCSFLSKIIRRAEMRRIKEVLFCDQDRNLKRKRIKIRRGGEKYFFITALFSVK